MRKVDIITIKKEKYVIDISGYPDDIVEKFLSLKKKYNGQVPLSEVEDLLDYDMYKELSRLYEFVDAHKSSLYVRKMFKIWEKRIKDGDKFDDLDISIPETEDKSILRGKVWQMYNDLKFECLDSGYRVALSSYCNHLISLISKGDIKTIDEIEDLILAKVQEIKEVLECSANGAEQR